MPVTQHIAWPAAKPWRRDLNASETIFVSGGSSRNSLLSDTCNAKAVLPMHTEPSHSKRITIFGRELSSSASISAIPHKRILYGYIRRMTCWEPSLLELVANEVCVAPEASGQAVGRRVQVLQPITRLYFRRTRPRWLTEHQFKRRLYSVTFGEENLRVA